MAAEFKFPNEIDPLGSNMNRSPDFQKMPPARPKQISVHIGEIIRGKIIDVISEQQAVISLPDGTFSAEISGRFKSGDELFFRVQSVEPSLVLKIHSVFVAKDNKELSISEIMRILDLPKSPLFEVIVERAKEKANILFREDLILRAKYANDLMERNPKEELNQLLHFVDFALDNHIEPSSEFYQIFKKYHNFKVLFPGFLMAIYSNIELFPPEIKNKILAIRNNLQQNTTIINLIRLLSPNFFFREDNLFNILVQPQSLQLSGEIKTILDEIRNWFNSFWIVNASTVFTTSNLIYFVLPYLWENYPRSTLARYQRKKFGNLEEKNIIFEDEELIQPIADSLKREFNNYFSSNEGKNEFNNLLTLFKRYSRKEGNRLFVRTPLGFTQILHLLSPPTENTSRVSIVI